MLHIPAPEPGNIVGYEFEVEDRPFFLQDMWYFQEHDPVRREPLFAATSAGWEFKVSWLNHPEVKPAESGNNLWQWTVSDVNAIRNEAAMPPLQGVVAGQMIVTFFPAGGRAANGFADLGRLGEVVLYPA